MLDREIINKMDADELRNYVYHLQNFTKVVREINSVKTAIEDSLFCLMRQREDLSNLAQRKNDKVDQLAKIMEEMTHKYLSTCPSDVCEDNNKAESEDKKDAE